MRGPRQTPMLPHKREPSLAFLFLPVAQDLGLIEPQDVGRTIRPIARLIGPHGLPCGQLLGTIGWSKLFRHRILRALIDVLPEVALLPTLAGHECERHQCQPSQPDQPLHTHVLPYLPSARSSQPGGEQRPLFLGDPLRLRLLKSAWACCLYGIFRLSRAPRNRYEDYTALSPEDCPSLPVSEQKKTYGHSQGVGRLAEDPQRWSRIHWHGGRPGQGFGSRSAGCSPALIASTCPCNPPCSADHLVPTAGRLTHPLQFP